MTRREIPVSPDLNLYAVQEKAEKIAARAIKKGLSGGYNVTTEKRTETSPEGLTVQKTYLIIEGQPAKFNGYTFVALVEWIGDASVVTGSPTYEGAPVDRSTLVKGACDHCGTVRPRKSVIIVETESGERKQVGKSCVKDFLGDALTLSWFRTGDPFEELDGYTGIGTPLENTLDTLTVAASIVRQRGWVSKANAELVEKASTASVVEFFQGRKPDKAHEAREWEALHAGFDAAVDGATAQAALEFAQTLQESEWSANLKAVISQEWFDPKHLGLVVSLAGVYARSQQKAAEEAADPVVEEPFGSVGDKVTLTLKVVSSSVFETQYGITYANTFTGEGHRFKWLTGTKSFEEGETVTLKGTIKKYDEWNDKVFTVLTRCKEVAA